jgi:hypothetical protein
MTPGDALGGGLTLPQPGSQSNLGQYDQGYKVFFDQTYKPGMDSDQIREQYRAMTPEQQASYAKQFGSKFGDLSIGTGMPSYDGMTPGQAFGGEMAFQQPQPSKTNYPGQTFGPGDLSMPAPKQSQQPSAQQIQAIGQGQTNLVNQLSPPVTNLGAPPQSQTITTQPPPPVNTQSTPFLGVPGPGNMPSPSGPQMGDLLSKPAYTEEMAQRGQTSMLGGMTPGNALGGGLTQTNPATGRPYGEVTPGGLFSLMPNVDQSQFNDQQRGAFQKMFSPIQTMEYRPPEMIQGFIDTLRGAPGMADIMNQWYGPIAQPQPTQPPTPQMAKPAYSEDMGQTFLGTSPGGLPNPMRDMLGNYLKQQIPGIDLRAPFNEAAMAANQRFDAMTAEQKNQFLSPGFPGGPTPAPQQTVTGLAGTPAARMPALMQNRAFNPYFTPAPQPTPSEFLQQLMGTFTRPQQPVTTTRTGFGRAAPITMATPGKINMPGLPRPTGAPAPTPAPTPAPRQTTAPAPRQTTAPAPRQTTAPAPAPAPVPAATGGAKIRRVGATTFIEGGTPEERMALMRQLGTNRR